MKFACVLLMALVASLALFAVTDASPIQMVQASSKALAARQQVVSAPVAAAAASDDDDDDDDDDDIEDALDDDDDDDDDDEPATANQAAASSAASDDDDDEDDDYIERFFDDILGDEEDDDDDDVSPSTGVQTPVAAPAAPASVAAAVASPADDAIAADYPIADASDSVYDDETGAGAVEDGIQVLDTAPGDAVKEPAVVSAVNTVADTPVPVLSTNSVAASSSSASDDDEDDEEDDDLTDALDEEEDDEEEEEVAEADEEDDDEDDLIGEDVIEARARSLITATSDSAPTTTITADATRKTADTGSAASQSAVPDILINKYNRFVDGIFGRINTILKRSYDPVNVRLTTTTTPGVATAGDDHTKTTATATKTKKPHAKGATKKRKSNKGKTHTKSRTAVAAPDQKADNSTAAATVPAVVTHITQKRSNDESNDIPVGIPERFVTVSNAAAEETPETRAAQPSKPKKKTLNRTKQTKQPTANKQTPSVVAPGKTPVKAADTVAATAATPLKIQRARGVLYGLSTLQRTGNVRVNVLSDYTTVHSNFRLGPLQLKVEKAFGRGAKRELKSATATTTEMLGRIKLRIVNGAATLHSIKVQQPKQMQVVSADNHDRTREFLWKKSAHIADVVSQQLTAAARSMLQPPPAALVAENEVAAAATQTVADADQSIGDVTKTTIVELVGKDELVHELQMEQEQLNDGQTQ